MENNTALLSYKKLKKSFFITLIITLICGVFFFILNKKYTFNNLLLNIGVSFLYAFGLGFFQGFINEYLSSKWSWVNETNKRIWIGIVVTIIYTKTIVFIIHYILFVVIKGLPLESLFKSPIIWQHFLISTLSLGISAFLHARGFMMAWKASVTKENTQQKIIAKTETAKFETLKNQIDPHFLFNSLNVLASLIAENPTLAEKFTTKLSKVYRYVLEQRNKELVSLEEELNFAKVYMELLQIRFEDALTFEMPKIISNEDLKLVPLSLQILLENAVKHNVVSTNKPLCIKIFEDKGVLKVQNNFNPKEVLEKSTKVGLQNIADRYSLLSRKTIEVLNTEKTFTVSLPLLTKKESIMNSKDFLSTDDFKEVKNEVNKIKEFYDHLTLYILINIFLTIIIVTRSITDDGVSVLKSIMSFEAYSVWVFWGIGVFIHWFMVFVMPKLFSRKWEEEKMKQLFEKNKD